MPAPRTLSPRVLAAVLVLCALALPACSCPPLVERWDTPEATLAQWQAHLCRDEVQPEYGCLAASFQRRFAGFENYYAARAALLQDQPGAGWVFKHADLASVALPTEYATDGSHARIVLLAHGERLRVDFECEAWVTVTRADGSVHVTRERGSTASLLGAQGGQQWITFDRPALDPEHLQDVRSVHVDGRWLIANIDGLATDTDRNTP